MSKPNSGISKHIAENIFVRKTKEAVDILERFPSLIFMDELFSGTTPEEQLVLVKEKILPFLSNSSIMNIFTTHYPENVKLMLVPEHNISLYYIKIEKTLDGNFIRTFQFFKDDNNDDPANWWLRSNSESVEMRQKYRKYIEETLKHI
jgi:hypothetical protein